MSDDFRDPREPRDGRDGPTRLLVFRVAAERFAVPLMLVDEVMDSPPIQRLPDTPAVQLGVAALRGELVTVFDARAVLRVPPAAGDGAPRALLLFRHDGRRVGLAVDDVHDAITVDDEDVRSLPGADASDRTLVGLVKRNSDLIAILDAGAVLEAAGGVRP